MCVFSLVSAPGGDLQTLMDDDMVPYERDAVKFVRQVLEGILFLHERSMAHLDIKVRITSTLLHTPSKGQQQRQQLIDGRQFLIPPSRRL